MKYKHLNKDEILYEDQPKSLKFLYNAIIGRILLKIITLKGISKLVGIYLNSKISKIKIKKYIKNYKLDMTKYLEKNYKSFNDFFIRQLKTREFQSEKNEFVSTANSKISYYTISEDLMINVKNSKYSIKELIKDEKIPKKYNGGICLIYRLSPYDYHRYIFCDNGIQKHLKSIKGRLHTVNPIVYDKYKVFTENYREVSVIETQNFGDIIQIEVGALCVGKIINNNVENFKKYDEKGHFEFGGSTIIQLIEKDKVDINKQIIENTEQGIETYIDVGQIIGNSHN